jgi:hypothetical protein
MQSLPVSASNLICCHRCLACRRLATGFRVVHLLHSTCAHRPARWLQIRAICDAMPAKQQCVSPADVSGAQESGPPMPPAAVSLPGPAAPPWTTQPTVAMTGQLQTGGSSTAPNHSVVGRDIPHQAARLRPSVPPPAQSVSGARGQPTGSSGPMYSKLPDQIFERKSSQCGKLRAVTIRGMCMPALGGQRHA